MAENPYAAPKTRVEDAPTSLPDGDFLPEGRGVPAGNGWQWIADAWAFMAGQRWTFVGVFVLLMVINLVANFVPIVGPLALRVGFSGADRRVRARLRQQLRRAVRGRALVRRFSAHTGKLVGLGALSLAFTIVVIWSRSSAPLFLPMMTGGAEPSPKKS
jgi:hypothetical protein